MHGQEVGLGQRVLNLEDFGKVVDSLMSTLQRQASLILEASGCVDANRNALASVLTLGHSLDIFEVAYSPSQKLPTDLALAGESSMRLIQTNIGAHHGSPIKGDKFEPGGLSISLGLDWHIAKRCLALRDFNLEIEGRLQIRLIKARESPACITRLKLSRKHKVEITIPGSVGGRLSHSLVLGTIEARHGIVDSASEIDREDDIGG